MNEFEIIQNPLAGAHILHEFMKIYEDEGSNRPEKKGIKLPLLFMILPIVFNKDYVEDISSRNFKIGSMWKSLNNEKLYWGNLSDRMADFANLTFDSLNIAFSSSLLAYDENSTNIHCISSINILDKRLLNKDYKDMLSATSRLGHWLRELTEDEICSYFNLRY